MALTHDLLMTLPKVKDQVKLPQVELHDLLSDRQLQNVSVAST